MHDSKVACCCLGGLEDKCRTTGAETKEALGQSLDLMKGVPMVSSKLMLHQTAHFLPGRDSWRGPLHFFFLSGSMYVCLFVCLRLYAGGITKN